MSKKDYTNTGLKMNTYTIRNTFETNKHADNADVDYEHDYSAWAWDCARDAYKAEYHASAQGDNSRQTRNDELEIIKKELEKALGEGLTQERLNYLIGELVARQTRNAELEIIKKELEKALGEGLTQERLNYLIGELVAKRG